MSDNEHLIIRHYDPEATAKFLAAKHFILEMVPFPVDVEHIGSSSVPGLGGKRVIDIMILCARDRMRDIVSFMEAKGYTFNPADGFGTFPDKFFISGWFPYRGGQFHVHYHITFPGSNQHREKLLFRDYLRKHPDSAQAYYELKQAHCIVDGDEVTILPLNKDQFVADILDKAKQNSGM
ncbi:MAG: hypothetical protein QG656_1320 [Candidatus Hydrogenedentes bacterium]|nr:hypothetical protein [Candidatus Hydrogenedentota bacterium]